MIVLNYRQKLMRHGKKGKMSMFLDEAPQETIFIKEAIQLTTKVSFRHVLVIEFLWKNPQFIISIIYPCDYVFPLSFYCQFFNLLTICVIFTNIVSGNPGIEEVCFKKTISYKHTGRIRKESFVYGACSGSTVVTTSSYIFILMFNLLQFVLGYRSKEAKN